MESSDIEVVAVVETAVLAVVRGPGRRTSSLPAGTWLRGPQRAKAALTVVV